MCTWVSLTVLAVQCQLLFSLADQRSLYVHFGQTPDVKKSASADVWYYLAYAFFSEFYRNHRAGHNVVHRTGALAGLMQGPRATSLTDGLNRPQMSYSLPAQLPDPDQHMHEVYLAAQAAAGAASSNPQVGSFAFINQASICPKGQVCTALCAFPTRVPVLAADVSTIALVAAIIELGPLGGNTLLYVPVVV